MDLSPYIQTVRDDLNVAAAAGGIEAQELAGRLTSPLESAMRLALLEALAAAAAEITTDLAPGSVDLRLRGRDPEFVVTPAPQLAAPAEPPAVAAPATPVDNDDSAMTRINLRLPQDLKDRVEDAARAAGLSVNAWLVRAATAALLPSGPTAHTSRPTARGGDRFSGWAR